VDLAQARRIALALPGAVEQPHFDLTSFRVRGKIFATATADEAYLHVFVADDEADAYVAENPAAFQPLLWGSRRRGVRVRLADAPSDQVAELIEVSWRRKAPARLIAGLGAIRMDQNGVT